MIPPDDRRGTYPPKIIPHREARDRALAALAKRAPRVGLDRGHGQSR